MHCPPDAFGDPFDLARLPLARPAAGYAVQWLGSDRLLDQHRGIFLPVRDPALRGLFDSFADAHAAACDWACRHGGSGTPALAIVPAGFDSVLERHVLIYGVLCDQP